MKKSSTTIFLLLAMMLLVTVANPQSAHAQTNNLSEFFNCAGVPSLPTTNGGCIYGWGVDMTANVQSGAPVNGYFSGVFFLSGSINLHTVDSASLAVAVGDNRGAFLDMGCQGSQVPINCISDTLTFSATLGGYCTPNTPGAVGVNVSSGPYTFTSNGWLVQGVYGAPPKSTVQGPYILNQSSGLGHVSFYLEGGGLPINYGPTISFDCPAGTVNYWERNGAPNNDNDMLSVLDGSGLLSPGFQNELVQISGAPGNWQLTFPDLIWPSGWSGTISTSYEGAVCGFMAGCSSSSTSHSTSPLHVSCSPNPQQIGSSISCAATVNSAEFSVNVPEVIDWSSDSLSGGFSSGLISSSSCFLVLPNNSCTIDYTDSSAGNFTITAFYEGDSLNPSASGSTVVAYRLPVNVNIWCRSSVGMLGHPDVCAALVDGTSPGLYPTGEVTVVANSTGFDVKPDDCQIGRISGTLGTFQFNAVNGCLFDVNSNVIGTAAVYAAYHGDNSYMPDVAATRLKFVNLTATSLSLSCSALTAPQGIREKCTAKVASDPPTGNVSWNATGSGSFSSDVCVLDNGTCGVTYSQSNASAATITALYEGDVTHAPSESIVTVSPVTNGTAFAIQTLQTGVDVTLTGSTGTLVSIYTSDYLSQPSGTGTSPYHNALYIDVMVSGGTAGSATICYYGPEINSTTQMSYYSSGKWSAATNENASAGFDVCGNIPAVSLTGTPIAIGDANSASGSLGGALHQLLANDLMIGGVAIPILYVTIAAVAAVVLLGIATFTIRKGRKQR